MMRCPQCRQAMELDATSHECGWRLTPERQPGEDDEAPAPAAPEPTREESIAAYERVRAMLAEVRQRPIPGVAERWRAILANPRACFRAQELAREALAEIEAREAIRHDAEIQERARRIVAEQAGKQE